MALGGTTGKFGREKHAALVSSRVLRERRAKARPGILGWFFVSSGVVFSACGGWPEAPVLGARIPIRAREIANPHRANWQSGPWLRDCARLQPLLPRRRWRWTLSARARNGQVLALFFSGGRAGGVGYLAAEAWFL